MRKIGALAFPGFELLDLFGPLELFGILPDEFAISLIAKKTDPVPSRQGPAVAITETFTTAIGFDILLVPGGIGTRTLVDDQETLSWIKRADKNSELTLSVCTGAALLARTGILDGRRATTNKLAFQWVAEQRDAVTWVQRARWVEDGKYFTSAGVSAGMDMSLAVIAHVLGWEKAEEVANWAEYDWHRDATWDPFSEKLGLA